MDGDEIDKEEEENGTSMAGGEAFLDSFWTARREQKQQWWSGCPGDRDARQNDAEDSTITFGWNFSVALLVRR